MSDPGWAERAGAPLAVLRSFRTPPARPRAGEVCEMCAVPVTDDHSHIVNVETRGLLCACRACYLLFTHAGAAQGKYRAVPDRWLHDPAFAIDDALWERLQIPVRMAFFFYNSSQGRFVAFYPSPAGATESLLGPEAWSQLAQAHPLVRLLAPDVEALLVHGRSADRFESFLVPIHACYELVGHVKRRWKGFGGGAEAWREIENFFEGVRARSRAASAADAP